MEIQPNDKEIARAVRQKKIDTLMKIVDHVLHPNQLLDVMNKFFRIEGPINFINNRFLNFTKAAIASNNATIEIVDRYNPNGWHFYSHRENENDLPAISGIIFPEGTYIEYDPLIEAQKLHTNATEFNWLLDHIKDTNQVDEIYGLISPGTYSNVLYRPGSFSLNEYGVAEVKDGEINVLISFMNDPINDMRVRNKPNPETVNDIYGGIVFYKNGGSKIVRLNELQRLIEYKEIDSDMSYIIEPNFLLTREDRDNGVEFLKETINKNREWDKLNEFNMLLHFETPKGPRIGYLSMNCGYLIKSIDIIEKIASSLNCKKWSLSIGEFSSGGIILLDNDISHSLNIDGRKCEGGLAFSNNLRSNFYMNRRDIIKVRKRTSVASQSD